ncbi:MAG TPA: nucleotidyltransferase domain-containing protein [Myxococcota bacterium]|nr:nucleotidyltransferase domain-containing protein [Myxococcota bacterium]
MLDAVSKLLADDPRLAYAVVFGSAGRTQLGPNSDLDVALELSAGSTLGTLEMGALAARLEEAAGRPVDLVLLDEAPPALASGSFATGRRWQSAIRPP